MLVEHVVEEGDGLDGLSQAHFICQDTAVPPTDRVKEYSITLSYIYRAYSHVLHYSMLTFSRLFLH